MGVGASPGGRKFTTDAGAALYDLNADARRWATLGLGLVMLVLGAAAVRSPRSDVELVVGVLAAALILWRLLAGIALFTVLTFPAHLPGGLGTATVAKPLGALIVAAWLLTLVHDRETPSFLRDRPFIAATLVGFLLWGLISVIWATDTGRVTSAVIRLAQVVILFFVSYSVVRTPRDVRVLCWAYVAAAFVTSAYALGSGQTYEGRLTGGVDPNYLAAELVPAILIGGFLLGATPRLLHRVILVAAIATIFVAFALTESRGGAVALATALCIAVIVAGPVRAITIATVLVTVGLAAVYYEIIAPAQVRQRVSTISAQTSSGRSDSWQVAGKMILHHPVGGVGLANFPVVQPDYLTTNLNLIDVRQILRVELVVHNTYLETFAELGAVGLLLLLLPIGFVIARSVASVRMLTADGFAGTSLVARGLIAGIAGLLVGYFFLSGEYEKQLWLLLGLTAGISGVAQREREGAQRRSAARSIQHPVR